MHSKVLPVVSLIVVALSGCVPVRLLERNDERIAQGMVRYQESLETFVRQTLFNYSQCASNPDEPSACRAASYENGQRSFYIPEAARLSVLQSRAAVLDSAGACDAAATGIATFVNSLIPPEIDEIAGARGTATHANCTQALVQTVIDNHEALAEGHHRIEAVAGADQADGFFRIQRDTLVQNVRVVLLLEEAKKRGGAGR
jgi:hypothetical protein